MSASQELEKAVTDYAMEAVRLDKQGARGMAITMYQKAIETLLKLVQLYPDYGLNKVYIQRAMAYQERIRAIQGGGSIGPQMEKSNGSNLWRTARIFGKARQRIVRCSLFGSGGHLGCD